jgi:hypothetical protein
VTLPDETPPTAGQQDAEGDAPPPGQDAVHSNERHCAEAGERLRDGR